MAMPDEMNTAEVCEFLFGADSETNRNNLSQIVFRQKELHKKIGHKNPYKCPCLLVEREGRLHGRKMNYYRRDKVVGYSLYRNGKPSDIGKLMVSAREITKLQRPGTTKGRPTNKVKR